MDVDHTNKLGFRQIAGDASIHGVRQLSLTYHHSKFILVGWIITICAAFITICYQINTLTSLILTYPSTIDVSIVSEQSVFPTVTACNMGVYKKSVVENIDTFVQMGQASSSVSSGQRSKREAINDIQIDRATESRQKRQSTSPCAMRCTIQGDFCYRYPPDILSSAGAQTYCATVGGKLPFFSTMAQYNSYYDSYQQVLPSIKYSECLRWSQVPSKTVWLGFWNLRPHNVSNPGIWRDANGTGAILSISNWCAGEPSGCGSVACNGNQKCAFAKANSNGCWQDTFCMFNNSFSCMCQCPTTIANGIVITPSVPTINYTAQFQCNSGYQLIGSSTLTCIINSVGGMWWDQPPPTCVVVIPAVSTAQFIATLDMPTNGTTDSVAAASQLNSAMEILLSGLTATQLEELGFQRNDFVSACLFSGFPCNNNETLKLVQIPEFLNCYAFNHRNQTNLITQIRSGETLGLSMAFNIQSEEYINTMSVAGVQLFVQDQFDPILPGSMGRLYSPGLLYYITLSKRVEKKLSVPGRPCITSAMENSFNLFNKNDTYFTESCLRSYLQINIIKKCGCGSTKYPLPNDNSKFCDLTTAKCASTYLSSNGAKLIEEAQTVCPTPCRSVSFDLVTTFARLSPQQSLLDNLNMTKTSYMNNVVMVKLFFATDTVMVYTEELNFGVMNVLSNIGGSLGCIAGISMISIAELFVMISKGVSVLKYKCC